MIHVRECEDCACLFENGRFFGPEFPDVEIAQEFIDQTPISRYVGREEIALLAEAWIRDHREE